MVTNHVIGLRDAAPGRGFRLAITPDRVEDREGDLRRRVDLAIDRGANGVVFREKRLDDADFLRIGREVRELCRERKVAFVLNERERAIPHLDPDAFQASFRSADLATLRRIVSTTKRNESELPLGVSVHGVDEGCARIAEGYDFLIFGPLCATPSKKGLFEPQGLEALRRLAEAVPRPVIAVGGIHLGMEADVLATGAAGVAMMRGAYEDLDVKVNREADES